MMREAEKRFFSLNGFFSKYCNKQVKYFSIFNWKQYLKKDTKKFFFFLMASPLPPSPLNGTALKKKTFLSGFQKRAVLTKIQYLQVDFKKAFDYYKKKNIIQQ